VGNAGDSRAVFAKKVGDKVVAVEMSVDHKPELPEEKLRIEKAGGFVEDNRVKGILNLSRSLGDLEYKNDSSIALKD
jgi:protein phosphatase 1G